MDKKLFVHLQGGRKVSGTLRGYDLFLNLVIDDAQEETTPAQRHPIGTVVRGTHRSLLPFLIYTDRSSAATVLLRWRHWRGYHSILFAICFVQLVHSYCIASSSFVHKKCIGLQFATKDRYNNAIDANKYVLCAM
jgi:small nuclear ribonucleoprotein (snRNP)-like protein